VSWLQKLYETYEACEGQELPGKPLAPIAHTTQQAHVEVVLDGTGAFLRASVLDKADSTTLIPCTEESGGRAGSKPMNHPLSDKLQYLADDYVQFGGEVTSGFAKEPQEPHESYLLSLESWASSPHRHAKVDAVLHYVKKGRLVKDLVDAKVLPIDPATGKLLKAWGGDKSAAPAIFKALPTGQAPEDAFIRWRVQDDHPASASWEDQSLLAAWVAYYASIQSRRGLCMVSGEETALAVQHPAKLRNAGDKAKLISSNDTTGYTFRGRFLDADEAASVGYEVTQKAHNALRWLIDRQGTRVADQAIVSWAVSGAELPKPMDNTFQAFGIEIHIASSVGDVGQEFAFRLTKAMAGYRTKLDPDESIVIMALESATPGRLAIAYYRELHGSEFLDRVETWHRQFAWPQNFGKEEKFVGAPAPAEIAKAAYGLRIDDKLDMTTRQRLLPCIVDGVPFPRDLVESTFRRVINRTGMENWEWERCLGIACALFKGSNTDKDYQMALETDRTTRDYLFGRLLAVAERMEFIALHVAGESRDTSAERLMQRFASHPSSTWRNLELALVPYRARLRNRRLPFLITMDKLIDDIVNAFEGTDFTRDDALSSEFLLGYHCQRQALRPKAAEEDDAKESVTESTPA
jgi:CRISPR-associated protein Csd1